MCSYTALPDTLAGHASAQVVSRRRLNADAKFLSHRPYEICGRGSCTGRFFLQVLLRSLVYNILYSYSLISRRLHTALYIESTTK